MFRIAIEMLLHGKLRALSTLLGVAVAFFLAAAQFGLLVGWCNTCSAIIRHANADIWVMAQQTPAFDYGTAIPRQRLYQVRSVPGVQWAEGMVMSWMFWQRSDGRQQNVEMVGIDESLVGGPWQMQRGSVNYVHLPDGVIIDSLYCERLGIHRLGEEAEIQGARAVVRGISENVRTLTAAPFIFTSLDSAVRYDPRYRPDELTYVLARCQSGTTPAQVRESIKNIVPSVDVWTSDEFAVQTMKYWMLETGLGITVVLTALLGVLVGTVITSQTLFAITNDHLKEYASLLALGFARAQLVAIVLCQALALGIAGVFVGNGLFWYAVYASARTPIPIETTPFVFSGVMLATLLSCVGASLLSVRSIFRIDPVAVFNG